MQHLATKWRPWQKAVILGRKKTFVKHTHLPPVQCVRTWGTQRGEKKVRRKVNRKKGGTKNAKSIIFLYWCGRKRLANGARAPFVKDPDDVVRQLVWQLVSLSFACWYCFGNGKHFVGWKRLNGEGVKNKDKLAKKKTSNKRRSYSFTLFFLLFVCKSYHSENKTRQTINQTWKDKP